MRRRNETSRYAQFIAGHRLGMRAASANASPHWLPRAPRARRGGDLYFDVLLIVEIVRHLTGDLHHVPLGSNRVIRRTPLRPTRRRPITFPPDSVRADPPIPVMATRRMS